MPTQKVAIRPWIGTHKDIGPDITASGWGQRYSTPYILPTNPPNPDYYHGPTFPQMDMRGRHSYRTQPREGGLYDSLQSDPARQRGLRDQRASLVDSTPYYAHGFGSADWSNLLSAAGSIAFAAVAILALQK